MRITTYCEFNTSLSTDNSEIDNWEDYVKYINDLARLDLEIRKWKFLMFLISFGKLDILIGIDVFISDRDGKAA